MSDQQSLNLQIDEHFKPQEPQFLGFVYEAGKVVTINIGNINRPITHFEDGYFAPIYEHNARVPVIKIEDEWTVDYERKGESE